MIKKTIQKVDFNFKYINIEDMNLLDFSNK